jgi:dTDP-4-amino-4,6-dideoxygalactose transaminase
VQTRVGGSFIHCITIAKVQLGRREFEAVQKVLKSGRLRAGQVTEDFESQFARAVGARYAVAVSSGTAALYLVYRALLSPGDEVIVPDFTFAATAAMVVAAGGQPVFADVDPRTFTLDTQDVERRITPRTRALVPVHLYGHPADVHGLLRLARRHRLRVIWDAAQAHGARSRGRDVGAFPDAVCYSFYPSKNMTTGEGGMITTSDSRLAAQCRLLRSHGEQRRYEHVCLGFNLRLTDVASALGRVQLAKLPAALGRRRQNARILSRGLADIPGIGVPHVAAGAEHAYCLYTITLDPERLGVSRDQFQQALSERGIETAVHYPRPLHRQPVFRGYGRDRDFPVSTRLAESVLSIPVYPELTRRDLQRIVRAVLDVTGFRERD